MKWLALLLAAVLLLIAAWFFFSPTGTNVLAPDGLPELRLPENPKDRTALVKSAQQLHDYIPAPGNVVSGVRFLITLVSLLSEENWPLVEHAIYVGWEKIHRAKGSQGDLAPSAQQLLDTMVPHLGATDLQSMIRSINANDYYGPQMNAALGREATKPVLQKGYAGSRLSELVAASVRSNDYARAHKYLAQAVFEEGSVEEPRTQVAHLIRILELYFQAKSGKPEMIPVVEEWAKAPHEPIEAAILLETGVLLASQNRERSGYVSLKDAMESTAQRPGAEKYWAEVLGAFLASLPKLGRYSQSDTLETLASSYGDIFQKSSFVASFWLGLADANQEKQLPEAMWRVECLKRAVRAQGEDAIRIKCLRRIVQEFLAFRDPARARATVEELAPRMESEEAKREIAALKRDLAKKEDVERVQAAQRDQHIEQARIRNQLDELRRHLVAVRKKPRDGEIDRLEKFIKELESKLTE
jgi:hypothetical protein